MPNHVKYCVSVFYPPLSKYQNTPGPRMGEPDSPTLLNIKLQESISTASFYITSLYFTMKQKTFHNIVLQSIIFSPVVSFSFFPLISNHKLLFLSFSIINIIKLNIKNLIYFLNIILKTRIEIGGKKGIVTP